MYMICIYIYMPCGKLTELLENHNFQWKTHNLIFSLWGKPWDPARQSSEATLVHMKSLQGYGSAFKVVAWIFTGQLPLFGRLWPANDF